MAGAIFCPEAWLREFPAGRAACREEAVDDFGGGVLCGANREEARGAACRGGLGVSDSRWDTRRGLSGRMVSTAVELVGSRTSVSPRSASGATTSGSMTPGVGCSSSCAGCRGGEGAAREGLGVRDPGGWRLAEAGTSRASYNEHVRKNLGRNQSQITQGKQIIPGIYSRGTFPAPRRFFARLLGLPTLLGDTTRFTGRVVSELARFRVSERFVTAADLGTTSEAQLRGRASITSSI